MSNVQVLDKPLQLMPGQMGFFKVKNSHLVIEIVSDENGVVSYTYPLKPGDKTVHTAEKKDIFIPLTDLAGYGQLNLSKSRENFPKGN